MKSQTKGSDRTVIAGVLAWLVPGAGHYYLGHRGFAAVFFAAITFAYVVGALIGGVKANINPQANGFLFAAEALVGGYTAIGFGICQMIGTVPVDKLTQYVAYYPASDVAQVYLAVAGLLNVLAVLDALSRAQTGGLPVYHHELPEEPAAPSAAEGGA